METSFFKNTSSFLINFLNYSKPHFGFSFIFFPLVYKLNLQTLFLNSRKTFLFFNIWLKPDINTDPVLFTSIFLTNFPKKFVISPILSFTSRFVVNSKTINYFPSNTYVNNFANINKLIKTYSPLLEIFNTKYVFTVNSLLFIKYKTIFNIYFHNNFFFFINIFKYNFILKRVNVNSLSYLSNHDLRKSNTFSLLCFNLNLI